MIKKIIFYLTCLFCYSSFLYADMNPFQRQTYANTTVGVSITGPDGWYLEVKSSPKEKGSFFQEASPPGLVAIFSSNDRIMTLPASERGNFGMIFISLFQPHLDAIKLMDPYSTATKELFVGENMIDPPQILKFKGRSWLVTRVKKTYGENVSNIAYQITYITVVPKVTIQIDTFTPSQSYESNRKLYDNMISHVTFDGK